MLRVGLCWQGSRSHRNDEMRSLTPEALGGFASITKDVEWYALCPSEYKEEMAERGLPDGLEGCDDWIHTARRIRGVKLDGSGPDPDNPPFDLIISVDTALVHLATVAGIETWLLLAAVPDFRWGFDGKRTPWSKYLRLYRQDKIGEWGPVVEKVVEDLRKRAKPSWWRVLLSRLRGSK